MNDTASNTANAGDQLDPSDPDYELKQRLEVARLERDRLAKERASRDSRRALTEKLADEERDLKNEQAIDAAEQEHGDVGTKLATVYTRSGVVIVKRAHSAAFRRFQDVGKQTTTECEKLLRPCLVYPDPPTFDKWADAEPAIILRTANAICTLAGVRTDEAAGK
jgi:hypothetical protein